MASVRNTIGIEDRGMCIEGQLTNLGEPPVSLQKIQPEEKGYGAADKAAIQQVRVRVSARKSCRINCPDSDT